MSAYGDRAPDYSLNTISRHWQSEFLGVFAPKLTMQFRHSCTAYCRKSQRGAPTARLSISLRLFLPENTQIERAQIDRYLFTCPFASAALLSPNLAPALPNRRTNLRASASVFGYGTNSPLLSL